jgi:hypothetical protein
MSVRFLRLAVWLYAIVLMLLTLGPASVRPETAMPAYLEHLAALGVWGFLLVGGYRIRVLLLILYGGAFVAFLEFFQIWAPGRHARLIDLTTGALGCWIGIGLGLILLRGLGDARTSRDPSG